jgi:hypothetical protein
MGSIKKKNVKENKNYLILLTASETITPSEPQSIAETN